LKKGNDPHGIFHYPAEVVCVQDSLYSMATLLA